MSWWPRVTRTSGTTWKASGAEPTLVFHTKATNSKGATMETQSQRPVLPQGYKDLLESTALVHVATIGPHGEPQNNPV